MKPHKWAKEIKAWADGAEIEYRNNDRKMCWTDCKALGWDCASGYEYRIKPQPKDLLIEMQEKADKQLQEFKKEFNQQIANIKTEYDLKRINKKPDVYLYVYARDGQVVYLYDEPRGWAEDYLGKIKLEQDNE